LQCLFIGGSVEFVFSFLLLYLFVFLSTFFDLFEEMGKYFLRSFGSEPLRRVETVHTLKLLLDSSAKGAILGQVKPHRLKNAVCLEM